MSWDHLWSRKHLQRRICSLNTFTCALPRRGPKKIFGRGAVSRSLGALRRFGEISPTAAHLQCTIICGRPSRMWLVSDGLNTAFRCKFALSWLLDLMVSKNYSSNFRHYLWYLSSSCFWQPWRFWEALKNGGLKFRFSQFFSMLWPGLEVRMKTYSVTRVS